MATTAVAPALNLGRTGECKEISYHFSMGIGRMRQIATKVTEDATAPLQDEVVVVTTAKASEVRSQKRLMDSPELEEIRSQDGKLDRFIKSRSAYAGESRRYMLSAEILKTWKAMEAYRTIRRPQLVEAFMAKYEAAEASDFAEQKAALGNAFERSDYKPAATVRAGFAFWYTIHNVGVISLDGLPSEIVEMERQKEQENRAAAVDEFKHVLRATLVKLTDSLFNQVKPNVDGKRRQFKEACVDNVLEFVANFEKQDIAQDAEMAKVVANLKSVMKGVTYDKIQESDNLKTYIAAKLAEVKSTLGALVVETGRKFR